MLVERGGKADEPAAASALEKGPVPFERREGFRVEFMQSAPSPQAAVQAKAGAVGVDRDGVGRIGLKLDRVGAGLSRSVNQRQRSLKLSIMVAGQLGYDQRRLIVIDNPARDGERPRHVILLPFRRASLGDTR